MPHQLTVTGKTGPDKTVTAAVFPDVYNLEFNLLDKRLMVQVAQGAGDNIKEFDLSLTTVVTMSIVGGNFTVVVS